MIAPPRPQAPGSAPPAAAAAAVGDGDKSPFIFYLSITNHIDKFVYINFREVNKTLF